MQLVIDIPEEEYQNYLKMRPAYPEGVFCYINVIQNGIPLPKGHGKLIDYSWIVDNVIKQLGIKDERYLLEAEKALMSIVEIAPTIIEADKAESDGG